MLLLLSEPGNTAALAISSGAVPAQSGTTGLYHLQSLLADLRGDRQAALLMVNRADRGAHLKSNVKQSVQAAESVFEEEIDGSEDKIGISG
jgi:hypothetical protein